MKGFKLTAMSAFVFFFPFYKLAFLNGGRKRQGDKRTITRQRQVWMEGWLEI